MRWTGFGVLLEQPRRGGDLEVAADHRRAVGALLGALADDDPQGVVGAAAPAALAGELDDLGALRVGLHAVAVDADQRARRRCAASASAASETARDAAVSRSLIGSQPKHRHAGKDASSDASERRSFPPRPNIIGSMSEHRLPERDRPWVMRTYAGHSDARRSNELYRGNLAKGQTGLSVAFDLPTQTGYDPDHVLARGEVGKVGVSIAHKGDMHQLLDGIPLDEMNTSMTINATAAWLLGLYVTVAEENGVERAELTGHDPERHHQGVPLARHLRLPARALDAADRRHGRLHRQRGAELEPDQHLQLPPAGGRGDAGAGDRLRALAPGSPCSTR